MESDQEKIQFLGFLGIFKESFKIIFSWKKIFTQITLFLILPLSFIFLVQNQVSEHLVRNIRFDRYDAQHARSEERYHRLSSILNAERLIYWLAKIAYLVFFLVLSLLSTSAVVYTVACNYTGKPITFKKVMSVVPKVWKRVVVTFLWTFLFNFAYSMFMLGTFFMWRILVGDSPAGTASGIILLVLFFAGFVYLSIIWQLASVVSVLEKSYGVSAMIQSRDLIQGKRRVTSAIFVMLNSIYFGILIVYRLFVVYEWSASVVLGIGILCLVLLTALFLFGLVIQTVIYFVCKSYHCESIDKPALADHLEAYFHYEPLNDATKGVHLEQVHVQK